MNISSYKTMDIQTAIEKHFQNSTKCNMPIAVYSLIHWYDNTTSQHLLGVGLRALVLFQMPDVSRRFHSISIYWEFP